LTRNSILLLDAQSQQGLNLQENLIGARLAQLHNSLGNCLQQS